MRSPSRSLPRTAAPLSIAAVSLISGLVALVARPAADSLWLVSLGRAITQLGHVPDGIPFATADSHGWANVPVLSELAFAGLLHVPGARGLALAQVVAVAIAFGVLGRTALRNGASDASAAVVLLLVAVGSLPALVPIRAQLFSLALFPVLLALLHRETERPTRAIWLVVPLLALWSSLHGAALIGALVVGCYLVLERLRRRVAESCLLLVATPLALCLTPALEQTPAYYWGVARNEAARRGYGLWEGLRLDAFDALLVVAAVALAAAAIRGRPHRWELLALVATAALTVFAARNGVWFLMLAVVPAARGLARLRVAAGRGVTASAVAISILLAAIGIAHRTDEQRGREPLVEKAVKLSAGRPILAEPLLAEEVGVEHGRVWMTNPIDAFARTDQRAWLDWLQGGRGGAKATRRSGPYVLTQRGSTADRAMAKSAGFRRIARDASTALYVRSGS